MLAWLLWQLERTERIRAAAGALMAEFGDEAYSEARRREGQANGDEMAGVWRRVALVVARWTPRRIGLDAAPPTLPEPNPLAEIVSELPNPIRLRDGRSGSNQSDGEAD